MGSRMKILVTGGGSIEPIDNVRAVCNFSTGKTSAFLSDLFFLAGNEVTEILSERAIKPSKAKCITYKTFAELAAVLEEECKSQKYDAVIHAAAVSDYSPYCIVVDGKEYSVGSFSKVPAGTKLSIKMKKNPKLIDSIKSWCGFKTKVVAFKLTSNATIDERQEAVSKIFSSHEDKTLVPDYVVSNDLSEISTFEHPCVIYSNTMKAVAQVKNLTELGNTLLELI